MIIRSDRTLVLTTIIIPSSSGPAGRLATNAMIVVGVLMPPLVAGGIMLESGEGVEESGVIFFMPKKYQLTLSSLLFRSGKTFSTYTSLTNAAPWRVVRPL
jgi:hypothetical protein